MLKPDLLQSHPVKLDLIGPEHVAPKDHVLESSERTPKDHVLESADMAPKDHVLESAERTPKEHVLVSAEMTPKDHVDSLPLKLVRSAWQAEPSYRSAQNLMPGKCRGGTDHAACSGAASRHVA